jgi:F-type H+-transporting ATPase subunit b
MQIYPDYTIFIQFGQFVILLILFNFLLFRPILNALKKRQGAIDSLAAEGASDRQEAEGLGKAYDEKLKERKLPILEEKEGLVRQTHAASMKIVEEAREELAGELAGVKDACRREADLALVSLKAESERLVPEVVAKIMAGGR